MEDFGAEERAILRSEVRPTCSVLTLESLERGFREAAKIEYHSPVFHLHPRVLHYYNCLMAREYWKQAYREWRMFRTAAERGWLNGKLQDM